MADCFAAHGLQWGFPGGSDSKESTCQSRRPGSHSWVRKIPWQREWLPTPIFLPGESHRQRSLEGYSPCGQQALDMTKRLTYTIMSHWLYLIHEIKSLGSSFRLTAQGSRHPELLAVLRTCDTFTQICTTWPKLLSGIFSINSYFNFSFNRAIISFLLITIAHFHVNFLTNVSLYAQNLYSISLTFPICCRMSE